MGEWWYFKARHRPLFDLTPQVYRIGKDTFEWVNGPLGLAIGIAGFSRQRSFPQRGAKSAPRERDLLETNTGAFYPPAIITIQRWFAAVPTKCGSLMGFTGGVYPAPLFHKPKVMRQHEQAWFGGGQGS